MSDYDRELSVTQIEDTFRDAMNDAGIGPHPSVVITADGRKHGYKVYDDKGTRKSGEYCLYLNGYPGGRPAGWFHCWRSAHGQLYRTWALSGGGQGGALMTSEESAAMLEAIERRKEEEEKRRGDERALAIREARDKWRAATPFAKGDARGRPYLRSHHLPMAPGAKLLGADIIMPLVDENGLIMSVQRILPDGQKRLQYRAPKRGNFIVIPERPRKIAGDGAPRAPLDEISAPHPPMGNPETELNVEGAAVQNEKTKPSGELSSPQSSAGQAPDPSLLKPNQKTPRVWICEGWATGATLWMATGERVICAVDAGNMMPVAKKIKVLYAGMEIVAAPDFDREHGNTGMAAAFELQDELGIPAVPPRFAANEPGSDWNDYYRLHGLSATRAALEAGLKRAYSIPDFGRLRRENMYPHVKGNGAPMKTEGNMTALLAYLGITARYNLIQKQVEVTIPGRNFNGDNAAAAADAYLASKCVEYGLPEKTWEAFAHSITGTNTYNPVRDWILSKPWDGLSRLQGLLDTVAVVPGYHEDMKELLITKWMTSAVASAFMPKGYYGRGCLVLQGRQSLGKTSWLKNLLPEEHRSKWFGEGAVLNVDNRDDIKIVVSKWITELGELLATFRRSELNKLKDFLTRQSDELRLPYAAGYSRYPRHTVFAASVNDRTFLMDDTGNTRWWVIECAEINYQHNIDTQQVWAEVYELFFRRGEKWYLTGEEEEARLEERNKEYRIDTQVTDLLTRRLLWDDPKYMWSWRTVTEALIDVGIDRPSPSDIQKATRVIKELTGQSSKRSGHNHARVYLLPRREPHPKGEDIDREEEE